MKNKKIFLLITIALSLFSNSLLCQNSSDIDSIISTYDIKIKIYQQEMDSEILKLNTENYTENKNKIISEYKLLLDNTILERNKKLDLIREKIQAKNEEERKIGEEIQQQEEELLRLKNEQVKIIKQQEEREEIRKKQIEIEKERAQLDKLREDENKRLIFAKSDRGVLYNRIKLQFQGWLNKSEMETSNEYEQRVKNQSKLKFQEIVDENILKSKKAENSIASACLSDYDVEKKRFLIEINSSEYYNRYDNVSRYIDVPSEIAPFMKSKFGCSNTTKRGRPMLVHILDYAFNDDNFVPKSLLFIFPNGEGRHSNNYNSPFYDDYYWNKTNIIEIRKKYHLAYAHNISRKPVKLINIVENLEGFELESDVYYFEWNDEKINSRIDITMENLNIILPKL